jgi:hypothetical protein
MKRYCMVKKSRRTTTVMMMERTARERMVLV